MEFCGCADVILSGSLLDPADLGFAAANFRFPPLVSIDANGPKLPFARVTIATARLHHTGPSWLRTAITKSQRL